jgi:flagellar protein FlaI
MQKVIKKYDIVLDKIRIPVTIIDSGGYVKEYRITVPKISEATHALLDSVRSELLKDSKIGMEEIFDPSRIKKIMAEFSAKTEMLLESRIAGTSRTTKTFLTQSLVNEMLGLGMLELLLADDSLEEIVINTSKEPVWVYHMHMGWLKSNVFITSEQQIQNYASIVARRVGRQITTLEPLLDAHLVSGDRANATLFPVSTKGNTLSIRKFARKPWTITDFLANRTISFEVGAFLWLAMQYELNIVVAGGTSSGKTATLNAMMPFIQANHRIISIEDTRELQLPGFLHWVPLTTRLPNPEGKGEITMLDLMINSLRMRPDRIVVGEIRRSEQAEVLFEAMHTGHSVYATLHADTADQTMKRMANPPISIPDIMLEALHLIVVQHRDRKLGSRVVYQVAELVRGKGNETGPRVNMLFQAKPDRSIAKVNQSVRVLESLSRHTGMTRKEMTHEINDKVKMLKWLVKNNVNTINDVGRVISEYYVNKDATMKSINSSRKPSAIIKPL